MPAKSQAQFKMIEMLRSKFKTEANTPAKSKWIWNPEWTKNGMKGLPQHTGGAK